YGDATRTSAPAERVGDVELAGRIPGDTVGAAQTRAGARECGRGGGVAPRPSRVDGDARGEGAEVADVKVARCIEGDALREVEVCVRAHDRIRWRDVPGRSGREDQDPVDERVDHVHRARCIQGNLLRVGESRVRP